MSDGEQVIVIKKLTDVLDELKIEYAIGVDELLQRVISESKT